VTDYKEAPPEVVAALAQLRSEFEAMRERLELRIDELERSTALRVQA